MNIERSKAEVPIESFAVHYIVGGSGKENGEGEMGSVKLEEGKIYTLLYADDMAENEEKMRNMLMRLEDYLENKNLELNTEKTKITVFRTS